LQILIMKKNKKIDICSETIDEQLQLPGIMDRLKDYHDDKLRLLGLQQWDDFKCPLCETPMRLIGLRSLELRVHAKDFGDVVVEMLCQKCNCINRMHFPRAIKSLEDFIRFLNNTRPQDLDMITERELLSKRYNNLMDEMMREQGEQDEHD